MPEQHRYERLAALIVLCSGRVYRTGRGRMTLKVFSKNTRRLDILVDVYGGNYYRQSSGYEWVAQSPNSLREVVRTIRAHIANISLRGLAPLFVYVDSMEEHDGGFGTGTLSVV